MFESVNLTVINYLQKISINIPKKVLIFIDLLGFTAEIMNILWKHISFFNILDLKLFIFLVGFTVPVRDN